MVEKMFKWKLLSFSPVLLSFAELSFLYPVATPVS